MDIQFVPDPYSILLMKLMAGYKARNWGLVIVGGVFLTVLTAVVVGKLEDRERRERWRSCENWNTEQFFLHAEVEDVMGCIRMGTDPNARHPSYGDYQDGWTPLHFAGYWRPVDDEKYNEMIFFLISAGANPFVESANGERAIDLIRDSSHHHYYPDDYYADY